MDITEISRIWRRPIWVGLLIVLTMVLAGCVQPILTPGDAPAAVGTTEAAGDTTTAATTPIPIPEETYNGMPVGFTEEGFPYRGDPNAPITIIEYSDFQCPFCVRYFVQTEPAINDDYVRSGQVRVIFRDFPIVELHPNAPAAHVASLCVAEQGAIPYWTMHEKLFQTQSEWSNALDPTPIFSRLAEESGVDMEAYEACVQADEKQALIDAALDEGRQAGVSGTPSFELVSPGGETYLLVGAQPYDAFTANLDALIAGEMPPVAAEQPSDGGGDAEIPFWATAAGWAPDPDRPGYNMAGDQYRGNLDAKVTVIEFTDFQCPYCRQHSQATQPALDEAFVDTGDVLWVFKHFPLDIHPQAPAAGVAAECAAEQGKFIEMSEALFDSQGNWSISDPSPVFVDLASQIDGIDTDAFERCLADPAIAERVDSDLNEGTPFVRGTPTFIVLYNEQGQIFLARCLPRLSQKCSRKHWLLSADRNRSRDSIQSR